MLVQSSPLSTGRFLLPHVLFKNSCAHEGFDDRAHTMQPNWMGFPQGWGRLLHHSPKAIFLLSLRSLLQKIPGLQNLKEARRLIFISWKCHFIFNLLTLQNPAFFIKVSRNVSLRGRLSVVFLSFSSFSPRKSKWYGLSCSPGLPYQLFGISVGQHRLSWEKGSGEVMWGLWCWMTACDEMRPTQTAMIESSCKVERFWWLKWWLSAEEILLPLSSK